MSNRTLLVAVAAILLAALAAWGVSTRRGNANDDVPVVAAEADEESESGEADLVAPADATEITRAAADESPAAAVPADGAKPEVAATNDARDEYPLVLRFLLPDRSELSPERATVVLEEADGTRRTIESENQHEVRSAIPFGVYRVRVEAEGFRHVEETFDLSTSEAFENRDPKVGFFRRVYLWSDDWIPVRVVTPDGRPFEAITEDLGWEPRRLFVDAFRTATRSTPIDPDVGPDEQDEGLAAFRPPKGWHNVRIADDVVGSLLASAPRPFWVGLWVHGRHFESRVLERDATELVFEVSGEVFVDRLCEVRFELVDRDSGLPVTDDAACTLKANTSAHRRDELRGCAPGEGGLVIFEKVIPGRHDLTIQRGGSFVQRQLDLPAGQKVHLGEIVIGQDAPIELRVVDAKGEPLRAIVEITPYRAGRHVEGLYHPNLHRTTNDEGVYELPVPETLSIVRARPYIGYGGRYGGGSPEVGTRNVLVDPESPPTTLTLTGHEQLQVVVEVEGTWVDGHRVTIEDPEVDLIVDGTGKARGNIHVVPGRYLARHRDAEGNVLGEREVTIDASTETIRVP